MAGAITTWTGALSTTWATAGNWSNGVPVDGDYVTISGSGNNIDGVATGIAPASLLFTRDWSKNAGSTGTKLQFTGCTNLWFESAGGRGYLAFTGDVDEVYVSSPKGPAGAAAGDLAFQIGCSGASVEIDNLWIQDNNCGVMLTSGSTCTNVYQFNSPNSYFVDEASNTHTQLLFDSGLIASSSAWATVEGYGGRMDHYIGAISTVLKIAGCAFYDRSSGTYAWVRGIKGIFSEKFNLNTKTITLAHQHTGMKEFQVQNDQNTITLTALRDFTREVVARGKTRT